MKTEFVNKLNDWYGSHIQRYEVINETEYEAILLVAYRDSRKTLKFEIVRLFPIGNNLEISIDKTVDELNMDSVSELIKTVVRVF